ncbi:cache domain-containing protein [Cohnella rhizosphaerae]|uniref:Cache domain-containing protein n=1 Tax=Cohnella rhizosphaerae TaxID=1457232 RepID=A0A9X4QW00_9BACL|nr:cache domain-containing protein [Cohnella rhizosphaerae]MDG0813295.1 cache domain-containing protein [Cohnella rhizosphaerae]
MYTSERTVLRVQQRANAKVLAQIRYNVAQMNEIVADTAQTLYQNNDVKILRYAKSDDEFMYQRIATLDTFVGTSSFLHSIFVYNGNMNRFYIGNGNVRALKAPYEKKFAALLTDSRQTPKLRLLPIDLDETGARRGQVDFFSYILFDPSSREGLDDALILNVKSTWLFDNLSLIAQEDGGPSGQAYLMDGAGVVLGAGDEREPEVAGLAERLGRQAADEATSGYRVIKTDGRKQFVTYMQAGLQDWTLIYAQPYAEVVGQVQRLRYTTLLLTVLFLVLALCVAVVVSKRLYRPVEQLFRSVVSNTPDAIVREAPMQDEMTFLSGLYGHMADRVKRADSNLTENRWILKKVHAAPARPGERAANAGAVGQRSEGQRPRGRRLGRIRDLRRARRRRFVAPAARTRRSASLPLRDLEHRRGDRLARIRDRSRRFEARSSRFTRPAQGGGLRSPDGPARASAAGRQAVLPVDVLGRRRRARMRLPGAVGSVREDAESFALQMVLRQGSDSRAGHGAQAGGGRRDDSLRIGAQAVRSDSGGESRCRRGGDRADLRDRRRGVLRRLHSCAVLLSHRHQTNGIRGERQQAQADLPRSVPVPCGGARTGDARGCQAHVPSYASRAVHVPAGGAGVGFEQLHDRDDQGDRPRELQRFESEPAKRGRPAQDVVGLRRAAVQKKPRVSRSPTILSKFGSNRRCSCSRKATSRSTRSWSGPASATRATFFVRSKRSSARRPANTA